MCDTLIETPTILTGVWGIYLPIYPVHAIVDLELIALDPCADIIPPDISPPDFSLPGTPALAHRSSGGLMSGGLKGEPAKVL